VTSPERMFHVEHSRSSCSTCRSTHLWWNHALKARIVRVTRRCSVDVDKIHGSMSDPWITGQIYGSRVRSRDRGLIHGSRVRSRDRGLIHGSQARSVDRGQIPGSKVGSMTRRSIVNASLWITFPTNACSQGDVPRGTFELLFA